MLAGRVMKAGKSSLSGQVLINGKPRDEGFRRVSAYVSARTDSAIVSGSTLKHKESLSCYSTLMTCQACSLVVNFRDHEFSVGWLWLCFWWWWWQVMQDDVMFSCLTVWETLWVAARLRLPSTFNLQKKKELAESVIAELGMRSHTRAYCALKVTGRDRSVALPVLSLDVVAAALSFAAAVTWWHCTRSCQGQEHAHWERDDPRGERRRAQAHEHCRRDAVEPLLGVPG